uniref:NACHT-NTPase and P-loop NTPases N-terminal domain-containing protein n=1 Tax=Mycena chlorophos TaxID=658473 RepID=A0ABQ0LHS1_MYCCL|nr:predicted protein [Mycena chlorophos]
MPSCFSPLFPRRLRRSRKKTAAAEKDVYVEEKDASAASAGTRAPSGRTRPPSPPPSSDTARTAKNVFVLCLRTLGSVSENIPFGSVLNSAIDPLLDIMSRVEQTSENERGFVQLASRIELLTPIVADKKAQEGKQIVEALERELQSIHDDIKQALSHGKIAQFFNTEDNSSGIVKHNANLTQLIGDSTQESVNEILKTVRALEVKKEEKLKIVGGFGGSGGSGYRGGTGGEGEGPALELEKENIASISSIAGGFGGTGGDGVEVGGTGGVGKAPIDVVALHIMNAVVVFPALSAPLHERASAT